MNADLESRAKACQAEITPLLSKHNVTMGALPTFPIYRIIPVEVDLALKVLEKHGVKYSVAFQERKNANKI